MWPIPILQGLERKSRVQLEDHIQIEIQEEDLAQFRRLDQFLSAKTQLSRMTIKRLFESQEITAQVPLKLNRMPRAPLMVWINIPPPIPSALEAEKIPLDILYEDEYLIFLNKPAGMVVHPAPGNHSGTLLNALLAHFPHLSGIGGVQRPGIVHRLDKGTSGIMVVAKTQDSHEKLIGLFAAHDIQRIYRAIAQLAGPLPPVGTVSSVIGRHPQNRLKMSSRISRGKSAVTHYCVVKQYADFQLLELQLETGRTHQIRVHLSEQLKTPILCDPLYGNPKQQLQNLGHMARGQIFDYPYPLLHAQKLGLLHPITQKYLEFQVPPPSPFRELLNCA